MPKSALICFTSKRCNLKVVLLICWITVQTEFTLELAQWCSNLIKLTRPTSYNLWVWKLIMEVIIIFQEQQVDALNIYYIIIYKDWALNFMVSSIISGNPNVSTTRSENTLQTLLLHESCRPASFLFNFFFERSASNHSSNQSFRTYNAHYSLPQIQWYPSVFGVSLAYSSADLDHDGFQPNSHSQISLLHYGDKFISA